MKPIAWQKQDLRANNIPPNSLLQEIREEIKAFSQSPYLDALVLLSHITSKTKTDLITHPSPKLSPDQSKKLRNFLEELKDGIPLPYVLGTWEFFQLKFKVTPDVLIPRPESEWLVKTGINWLTDRPNRRTCLDLGTGTGCLAISLVMNIHDLLVFATDRSYQALLVAQDNALHHNTQERIHFILADLTKGLHIKVDVLVANLPYIPTNKLKTLPVYKTEPQMALNGGRDGLSYIKETLKQAPSILKPGGVILLELDETTGEKGLDLANGFFPAAELHLIQDLSGQDRYLEIQT